MQRAVEFHHSVVPWAFRVEHRTQDSKFCYFSCSTECRERRSFATLSYLGPSEWITGHKTQSSAISLVLQSAESGGVSPLCRTLGLQSGTQNTRLKVLLFLLFYRVQIAVEFRHSVVPWAFRVEHRTQDSKFCYFSCSTEGRERRSFATLSYLGPSEWNTEHKTQSSAISLVLQSAESGGVSPLCCTLGLQSVTQDSKFCYFSCSTECRERWSFATLSYLGPSEWNTRLKVLLFLLFYRVQRAVEFCHSVVPWAFRVEHRTQDSKFCYFSCSTECRELCSFATLSYLGPSEWNTRLKVPLFLLFYRVQRAVEFRHSVVPRAFRVEHDSKFCYFSCSTECRERWSFATLSYLGPSEWNTEHKTQSSAISLVLQSAESGGVSPRCRTLGLQSGTQNTRLKVLLFLLFYRVQRAVEYRHSVVPWAFRVEHKTQSSAISLVLYSSESGGVSPRCRTLGLQSGTQDSKFCYFSCFIQFRELWSFATLSYLGPSEWNTRLKVLLFLLFYRVQRAVEFRHAVVPLAFRVEHKTQRSAISLVLQSAESCGVSPLCRTLGLQSGAQNTRLKVLLFLLFYRVQRAVEFRHAVVPWAFRVEHRTQESKFRYFYCSTEYRERWSFATLLYPGPSEWSTEHKTQSSAISIVLQSAESGGVSPLCRTLGLQSGTQNTRLKVLLFLLFYRVQRAAEFRHSVVPWAFRVDHRTQDSKFCYFSCSTECRERWSFATLSYLGPSEWNTEHKTQSSAISLVLQSADSGGVSPLCRTLGLQSGTQNTRLKVLLFLLFYRGQRAAEFRHSVVPWAFRVEHRTQDSKFCYFSCSTECRERWSFTTLLYLGPSECNTRLKVLLFLLFYRVQRAVEFRHSVVPWAFRVEHKTQSSAISLVLQSAESGGVSPLCRTLGLQSGTQNTRLKVLLFLLFYRVQRAMQFRHSVVPWAFRVEHTTQSSAISLVLQSAESGGVSPLCRT